MKILIVYHSAHNLNTEKIARTMAEILAADIATVASAASYQWGEYDLIGFGSGIYFSRHHPVLLAYADSLPQMMHKKVFLFSTRGIGPVFWYHRTLRKKLIDRECEIIGEFSCKGFDNWGLARWWGGINKKKPDTEDIRDAKIFAQSLIKISDETSSE